MPGVANTISFSHFVGFALFVVLWLILFECAHLLVTLLRNGPLIGWAISPLGVTVIFLYEPSTLSIWLNVLIPALISGCVLYIGLFTPWAPIPFPHYLWLKIPVILLGVLLTSTVDFFNALRDLRYPLWGEARLLRSIQLLRASYASIHFTSFGLSYLRDHFNSNLSDLLQVM
ncbi:MAG: hypothetical protein M3Z24_05660 [Chloroflexota bacterium]|nr:hypothetical protein [Chloroflexota bacterium]